MANVHSEYSVSASIPSSTAGAPLYNIPLPSFLANVGGAVTWTYTTAAIILALLALEQSVYRYKKGHLPGDTWTIPIIGKFADSLKPTMEGYKKQWDSGALTALSVFNIFIVMASSNEYSRKILNSPNHAEPCLVQSAKTVLQADNWVFLTGKVHVEYRRGLNHLFTRKALGTYFTVMDNITRQYLSEWMANAKADPTKPMTMMMAVRDLNMETSLRVFCGNYIPDHAMKEINKKYWAITVALELVNFPLALPGTKVYRAVQARKVAMHWLTLAAHDSKKAMAEGKEPDCMLDEWVRLLADPAYKGRREFNDRDMAMVVFSFLFASQDAMSSGLIYGFQHLADHPDIFAKIRAEVDSVRHGQHEKPFTIEEYDQMPYLKAMVKESMRVVPPVTMVPYTTKKPFPISSDYTVPTGSMVIPSFYNSLHDPNVYPEPDKLIPERWLDPESPANANPQNYLVFGSGPHKCIGYDYAMMNIAIALALAVESMDFEHVVTPKSSLIQIIATLFPQDGLLVKFKPRASS
ncbi:cytochrome P450 [Auriscalpium vulgare]|uniref:Cytochrome P450 n=1 Tax=Auriscalpium vulgare TaxID=40419 RepID=A0ACB8RNY3_9AGAM|nr:cytochrome P450 [Auriscalpium vulgare]